MILLTNDFLNFRKKPENVRTIVYGGKFYGEQGNQDSLKGQSERNYPCYSGTFCNQPFSYQPLCGYDHHEIPKE